MPFCSLLELCYALSTQPPPLCWFSAFWWLATSPLGWKALIQACLSKCYFNFLSHTWRLASTIILALNLNQTQEEKTGIRQDIGYPSGDDLQIYWIKKFWLYFPPPRRHVSPAIGTKRCGFWGPVIHRVFLLVIRDRKCWLSMLSFT